MHPWSSAGILSRDNDVVEWTNVTIKNGYVDKNVATISGASSVWLEDVTVTQSRNEEGYKVNSVSGIYLQDVSDAYLLNVSIIENDATWASVGGLSLVNSVAVADNLTLSDNAGGYGVLKVDSDSSLTVNGGTFSSNEGDQAFGVFLLEGYPVCAFS